MPPRPPQRTGVVVQLTDELLELYSLDISQPSGTSDLYSPSRVHHGLCQECIWVWAIPELQAGVSGRSI